MNELLKILYPTMEFTVNPFGYIPETPKPNSAFYNRIFTVGGTLTQSFDWRPYAPVRERQYWVPFCVSFSRLNCGETLAKKQGVDVNMSDRELGVISGTTIYGNSLETVSETFRVKGVRREDQVPFTDRMLTYAGDDIWKEIFAIPVDNGEFRFKGGSHSWVYGRPAMVDALKFSPLQIAVGLGDTWEDEGVVKAPKNIQAYHAIMLMFIDADGFMYIQDSIGKEFKKLSPDYPLTGCKSFRDLPGNWKEIMIKKYKVVDTTVTPNKIGIAVVEGFTGNFIFAKDMPALNDLYKDFEVPADALTLTLT